MREEQGLIYYWNDHSGEEWKGWERESGNKGQGSPLRRPQDQVRMCAVAQSAETTAGLDWDARDRGGLEEDAGAGFEGWRSLRWEDRGGRGLGETKNPFLERNARWPRAPHGIIRGMRKRPEPEEFGATETQMPVEVALSDVTHRGELLTGPRTKT